MLQKEKITQASRFLAKTNIDMWIMLLRETTMLKDPMMPLICDIYFSGMAAIIVEKNGKCTAITSYLEHDSALQTGLFDEVISYELSFEDAFSKFLPNYSHKRIALDFSIDDPSADGLPYGMYLKFKKILDDLDYKGEIVPADDILSELRSVKNTEEVDNIKASIKLTERIFEEAKFFIKVGVTERDIFDFFQAKCTEYGTVPSWELNQCPGVSVYPDTPKGHCGPTDIPVMPGSLIGVDFGVIVNGYCSDQQRMYYVLNKGETEPPEHLAKAFEDVRDCIVAVKEFLKPGVTGNQTDTMSREYLRSRGYGEWKHSLGHQVGRYVHDGGATLSKRKKHNAKAIDTPLKAGNVFALEPAAYVEEGCFCIEEMVLLTENGSEFLSHPQQEMYVLKG